MRRFKVGVHRGLLVESLWFVYMLHKLPQVGIFWMGVNFMICWPKWWRKAAAGVTSMLSAQAVAKGMVERGEGGSIVNVSSLSSLCALRDHAVYCELTYSHAVGSCYSGTSE